MKKYFQIINLIKDIARIYKEFLQLNNKKTTILKGTGIWRRLDTCICTAESFQCSPETTTTLLFSYIPMQNKKFKVCGKKTKQLKWAKNCENSMEAFQTTKSRTTIWRFLKQLKTKNRPSNSTPGYISKQNTKSKRYMCPNVHSNIIYNFQDMEAI